MDFSHLSKLSDKVLAKFARRASTARMVLPESMRADFDKVVTAVGEELNRRTLAGLSKKASD